MRSDCKSEFVLTNHIRIWPFHGVKQFGTPSNLSAYECRGSGCRQNCAECRRKCAETTHSLLYIFLSANFAPLFRQPLTQHNSCSMFSDEDSKAREDGSKVRHWAKTRGGSTRKAQAVLQALRYHSTACTRSGGDYASSRVKKGVQFRRENWEIHAIFLHYRHLARAKSLGATGVGFVAKHAPGCPRTGGCG